VREASTAQPVPAVPPTAGCRRCVGLPGAMRLIRTTRRRLATCRSADAGAGRQRASNFGRQRSRGGAGERWLQQILAGIRIVFYSHSVTRKSRLPCPNPVASRRTPPVSPPRGAQRAAKAERERPVVEGPSGGLAMAEIARREGITERGLRKYVRNLIARRAPEATGEFIAVQMSRLHEALLVSFGASRERTSRRSTGW
jgi:hypothetical protein